jgi:hypothetical protein
MLAAERHPLRHAGGPDDRPGPVQAHVRLLRLPDDQGLLLWGQVSAVARATGGVQCPTLWSPWRCCYHGGPGGLHQQRGGGQGRAAHTHHQLVLL